MRYSIAALIFSGLLLSAGSAAGQSSNASAPTPATLKAAREAVTQMQGDRTTVLSTMSAPMVSFMQQMGVREPDHAQVLVQEVVMPVLSSHYDELLDLQAKAYASALSTADLQAISAYYASSAGRNLAAAQPTLAQAQLNGMTQWMGTISPELQTKLAKAIQAHGWGPSSKAK